MTYIKVPYYDQEKTLQGPIKFNEVCPEVRQRVETNTNKWLEVILAMLVQFAPHPPNP
jgi:hypothetical protein